MPKENQLFIQSTFRTGHSIDLTYLVHKNSPRWREVCVVISVPTGEVENLFNKELKCITTAMGSSKRDKKIHEICSLISYQKNYFT
jgi:hypothetical protein